MVTPSQNRLEIVRAAARPRCLTCGSENPVGTEPDSGAQEVGIVLAAPSCRHVFRSLPFLIVVGARRAIIHFHLPDGVADLGNGSGVLGLSIL